MKKRKSTRETKNMIQTALWLPRDMHEKLKEDGGERGLGDEIRRRLRNSFDDEQLLRDPITDELLGAIKQIEGNFDEPWHSNRFTYEVFEGAINELLVQHRPSREAQLGTESKLQTMYGADGSEVAAQTIGRTLAHVAINLAKKSFVDKQKE